jgi:hypothetical protein
MQAGMVHTPTLPSTPPGAAVGGARTLPRAIGAKVADGQVPSWPLRPPADTIPDDPRLPSAGREIIRPARAVSGQPRR